MKIENVYLIDGKRTAITNFCSPFSKTPAHRLSKELIEYLVNANSLTNKDIDEVIIGQAIMAGCGQNPARQAAIEAGLDYKTIACTINQMCVSGLKSITMAAQSIMLGSSNVIIACGQENMSIAPHAVTIRNPPRMGHFNIRDLMLIDGLIDSFGNYHMGITAENLTQKYKISREEQDKFAYNSHIKATKAITKFSQEIIPININNKKGNESISKDEFIKPDTNMSILSSLKPAFTSDGSITAGNTAGINDGAACVLLANEKSCKKLNLKPIAKLISASYSGIDPTIMGIAPIQAINNALKLARWKLEDLDIIEINESFAAQVISICKEIPFDKNKINVNGGALALGHPIGCSGSRCLVTAIHEMQRNKYKKCLISLCAGGGIGAALCIENIQ